MQQAQSTAQTPTHLPSSNPEADTGNYPHQPRSVVGASQRRYAETQVRHNASVSLDCYIQQIEKLLDSCVKAARRMYDPTPGYDRLARHCRSQLVKVRTRL